MSQVSDKIIFTGPVGAGKTTAITAISDIPPVRTDVACRGDERRLKDSTTVAMDYSYIQLSDGKRVHLYGTPGQERFDFMWKILTQGGLGLVLLVNNDDPDPLAQMEFYLDAFADFISDTGVVIGVTRMGVNDNAGIGDYQQRLFERNQIYPVFEVDGRSSDDVRILVNALLAVLEN
jgi:signal recognition particle receptor subunit beta